MIKQRLLLRAAPITALLFFALPACSTQGTDPLGPATNEADAPSDSATETAAPQNKQGKDKVNQERTRFLVKKALADANRYRANNEPELAMAVLLDAKKYDPANRAIQAAIVSLRAELGLAAGLSTTFDQAMQNRVQIQQERARAQVKQSLQEGQQLLSEHKYDLAVHELRTAILRVEALPHVDWAGLGEQAAGLLSNARAQRTAHEVDMVTSQQQEAMSRLRAAEAKEQARVAAHVNSLVHLGQRAYVDRKFKEAQELAERALSHEPTNIVAKDLANAAFKSLRTSSRDRYYKVKADEYLRLAREVEDLKNPQTAIMTIDGDKWARAIGRGGRSLPAASESPEDSAIRKKVSSSIIGKMSFSEDGNGPYLDAFKVLDTQTQVPIIVTPEGKEAIESEDLKLNFDLVTEMTLENMLNHMAGKSETLAWTIRHGVVIITNKTKAGGDNLLVTHDIRNLIFPITEFLPPKVSDLPSGEDESTTPRTGGESDEKVAFIEIDTLVSNIKSATNAEYWDGDSGANIDQVEGGFLLVKANSKMQRDVAAFLDDMDRFSTAVVTVETKFLTINENFLQEVGIDFRGTGGSGNKGLVAPLDDITNGHSNNAGRGLDNSGTADPAASPTSGFFFDDGGDGDFRGRTENYFTDKLGKVLTPTGGLTAAVTYLDDLQVNMIFRAVQKTENAQLVNSQNVTVLNNNRANVSVINQTSYVRDFDVEVAQASFIADPKIDVIHDGIVLDVRPIIRHDRKSVTLIMEPTLATLQRPIPLFTTSLAGSTLPVTLQLPILTVKSFATTAQVPDGGTVLIGGLRTILTRERRAETPILAKIPVLSFFFKSEGVIDEASSLMVMVKAQITDVVDTMNEYQGK
jgi:general secretion pathway protein D